jgi:hypothetical protein
VKRYTFLNVKCLIEDTTGDFVKYEDVKVLEEERDKMLEDLEDLGWPTELVGIVKYCGELQQEIERLEKIINNKKGQNERVK